MARPGAWQLRIVDHSTGKVVAVPTFGPVTWQRRLDNLTTATAIWRPNQAPRVEKWRHELEIWSRSKLVWAGPIIIPKRATNKSIAVTARDLGMRFERLFIARDRDYEQKDLGLIFGQITKDALEQDPLINLDVVTHPTGTLGDRKYFAANYERLADKLRELARTDVDYTFIGRQLIVGGSTIPDRPVWKLHDAMVDRVEDNDDGLSQVNDAVVMGGKPTTTTVTDGVTTTTTGDTAIGRWTDHASVSQVGPLQLRYDEPDIKDPGSAGTAARNRVGFYSTVLPDLSVWMKEGEYDLDDLVPGALVDVVFSERVIPYGQEGNYLLLGVDGAINDRGVPSVRVSLTQSNQTE